MRLENANLQKTKKTTTNGKYLGKLRRLLALKFLTLHDYWKPKLHCCFPGLIIYVVPTHMTKASNWQQRGDIKEQLTTFVYFMTCTILPISGNTIKTDWKKKLLQECAKELSWNPS